MTKTFGIVEGFFSDPVPVWTWAERTLSLDFISKYTKGINTYLYCPKNDLFITQKPYLLYPENLLLQIQNFIELANSKEVCFIYGLNPTLSESSINNSTKTVNKIVKKLDQLFKVGCRNFALLFDDLEIAYDVFTKQQFDQNFTDKIVLIVNQVYQKFEDKVNSFYFCAPDYNFKNKSAFTESIKKLNPKIVLFWTGNEIFSADIKINDLKRVKSLTKNSSLALWSNYPVNDAEQNLGCFNLGGFYPPEESTLPELNSIFVNPMREIWANLPFYITFNDYIQNPNTYDKKLAWDKALSTLGLKSLQKDVIQNFRMPNFFDLENVKTSEIIQNLNWLKHEKSEDLNNLLETKSYRELFLSSIEFLFEQANFYSKLCSKIQAGDKITTKFFKSGDFFPTKINIARYYPDIYNIIEARMGLYSNKSKVPNTTQFKSLCNKLLLKYPGRKSLKITLQDKQIFLEAINKLINFEQMLFLEFLNSNNVSSTIKLDTIFTRKNVNRFNLGANN